jgi:hypothetical protein
VVGASVQSDTRLANLRFGVIRVDLSMRRPLPIFPNQRTCEDCGRMTVSCHKQKLFDDRVRPSQERLWNHKAERLCGLEVDVQSHFCRLLDR